MCLWWVVFRVANFKRAVENAYFMAVIFLLLGDFYAFGSILGIFGSHFSGFCRFFNSEMRYTRKLISRLYYSPSPTRVKAGQLGPRGVVFVQLVDLALNALFPLLESSLSTLSGCRSHWWDPLTVLICRVREGGDPGGSPPLFSLYFGLPSE
jgi:hypothetical protein